jgi:hypothetical protein
MAPENECARPPAPRVVWIHQIHAAGGASSSTTMVVMFLVCLFCVLWSLLVVCKKVLEHNVKVLISPYYKVNRHYFLIHPGCGACQYGTKCYPT